MNESEKKEKGEDKTRIYFTERCSGEEYDNAISLVDCDCSNLFSALYLHSLAINHFTGGHSGVEEHLEDNSKNTVRRRDNEMKHDLLIHLINQN